MEIGEVDGIIRVGTVSHLFRLLGFGKYGLQRLLPRLLLVIHEVFRCDVQRLIRMDDDDWIAFVDSERRHDKPFHPT